MTQILRPLSLGQLLCKSFAIYGGNFFAFLGISAIPNVILLGLQLGLAGPSARLLQAAGSIAFVADFAASFASLFVGSIVTAATAVAVFDVYLDRPPDLWDCFSRLAGKSLRVVYVAVVVELIVGFGSLLCIVPGIYWAGLYGLAIPAVVLENITGNQSLKRSSYLATNAVGRVVIVYFLTSIFTGIVAASLNEAAKAMGLMSPLHPGMTRELLRQISLTLGGILFGPISAIALTLEYYDQRVRKEAFDIDHMMRMMTGPEN
jgi:hypothetical protein